MAETLRELVVVLSLDPSAVNRMTCVIRSVVCSAR